MPFLFFHFELLILFCKNIFWEDNRILVSLFACYNIYCCFTVDVGVLVVLTSKSKIPVIINNIPIQQLPEESAGILHVTWYMLLSHVLMYW